MAPPLYVNAFHAVYRFGPFWDCRTPSGKSGSGTIIWTHRDTASPDIVDFIKATSFTVYCFVMLATNYDFNIEEMPRNTSEC